MALFVTAHPDAWLDGVAVAGQDLRLQLASAFLTGASPSGSTGIAARPGVRYGTGSPLLVQAASGMNITVNAGVAFVQGTTSATAGMYTCCLDTTATITAATSDPTNPRIDNVICQITDVGSSFSTTVVTLQTGTPAPSPVAPTLPANSLLLATVAVAAGVSTITAGNIADARVFTVATGGIVPMANVSGGISGAAGLYAHDLSSGRLKVSDGSGNARGPKTAPFAPASLSAGSQFAPAGTAWNLFASVTVPGDGVTEMEVIATWQSMFQQGGGATAQFDLLQLTFALNGNTTTWSGTAPGFVFLVAYASFQGGSFRSWIVPPAGTATIGLYARNWNISNGAYYGLASVYLRAQANPAQ